MKGFKHIFVCIIVLSISSCAVFDMHSEPSSSTNRDSRKKNYDIEEEILSELNFARTKPADYADTVLKPMLSRFNGKNYQIQAITIRTKEGSSAVNEAIVYLKKQKAIQPLRLDKDLSQAAKLLADYQAESGAIGHYGPSGMDMKKRIETYGRWESYIGENIAYGAKTARDIVAQLIIDDGVASRGHRKNIYNGSFTVVGIHFKEGQTVPYGSVCVMDFAGAFVGY